MSAERLTCDDLSRLIKDAKAAPALEVRALRERTQRLEAEGRANNAEYLAGIWQSIGIISLIGNGIMAMVIVIQGAIR